MRRTIALVTALFLAAVAGWGIAKWLRVRSEPVGSPPGPAEIIRVPATQPAGVVEIPQEPPVSGLVLGENRAPLAGLTVICGDESRVTGGDGGFQFPPRRREWPLTAALQKDSVEILRWEGIGRPLADGRAVPGRIRWTLNVFGEVPSPVRSAKGETAAAEPKSDAQPTFAHVRGVFVEEWGTQAALRVTGSTPLPDGAHLNAALYFDGDRVISSIESAAAQGGKFEVRIEAPDTFTLHAATYRLVVTFGLGVEDFQDIERWRAERPEFPWDRAEDLSLVIDVFVGVPQEEQRDNREIETYFRRTLEDVHGLRTLLTSRAREARALAKNWDPALAAARRSVQDSARRDGSLQVAILDAAGRVDLEAWRQFLDVSWRPEVQRLMERQSGRLGGKYRKKEHVLAGLLERLIALSKMESVLVYQGLGLAPHPSDFFLDAEMPEGDLLILQQIMDKDMALLQGMGSIGTGERGGSVGPAGEQPASKKVR